VVVPACGVDAAAVGVAGLVVAAEAAEGGAEAAPGVALVVGAGQVLLELLGRGLPRPGLLVLEGQAEPEARVVRSLVQHAEQGVDARVRHAAYSKR
jgi:hypothetical protein